MNEFEMREQARLERNRYQREYRKRNPERTREANARYWVKRAAKRREAEANAAKKGE